MARQLLEFTVFGQLYRSRQFSAVEGMSILGRMPNVHPVYALSATEVFTDEGWEPLNRTNINKMVIDHANNLPPLLVLKAVVGEANRISFGFLSDWERVPVPNRFLSDANTVSAKNSDPLLSTIQTESNITLRDLEEYYSLEDAFKMFDMIMAKTVNGMLAQEYAEAEAKARR